ncbi:MarR family winged helix-turn-helix transcriptional regulator [Vibrio mimicus]|nr:MarR family winged helix-turn-helix transcriptional regulator [Vibrio mimicus]QXC58821.1 MarR family winged helix-turn-helix transcriptional regulator [Vibrio mimicus]
MGYTEKNEDESLIGVLCYQIATISKKKSELMLKNAQLDISADQAWILGKAYEKQQDGVHQSELVTEEHLVGAKSQVSRLIQDLVEKECLARRVDVNDRRNTFLVITNKGLDKVRVLEKIIEERKKIYLEKLTGEEYRMLVSLLKKALEAVKK